MTSRMIEQPGMPSVKHAKDVERIAQVAHRDVARRKAGGIWPRRRTIGTHQCRDRAGRAVGADRLNRSYRHYATIPTQPFSSLYANVHFYNRKT